MPIYGNQLKGEPGHGFCPSIITGIDGLATGNTGLYTIPTSPGFVVKEVNVRISALSGGALATPPSLEFGVTAAFDEWKATTSMTNMAAVNDIYTFTPVKHRVFTQTEVFSLNITTAGVGPTVLTLEAYVEGFFLR